MKALFATTALAGVLAFSGAGAALAAAADQAAGNNPNAGANVRVEQPAPQVTVQQPAPQVTVQQPKPQVTVQQPKPQVTVQQAKPDVTVQRSGQPDVTVQRTGQADVNVNRTGNAAAHATNAAPNQNTAQAGAADVATGVPLTEMQNLIGADVVTTDGENTGEIQNLLIGPQNNVRAAVIEWGGGIFGIGQNQSVVPIQHVQVGTAGDDKVRVDLTEEQLKALPRYEANKVDQYASRYQWGDGVRAYR